MGKTSSVQFAVKTLVSSKTYGTSFVIDPVVLIWYNLLPVVGLKLQSLFSSQLELVARMIHSIDWILIFIRTLEDSRNPMAN